MRERRAPGAGKKARRCPASRPVRGGFDSGPHGRVEVELIAQPAQFGEPGGAFLTVAVRRPIPGRLLLCRARAC